MTDNNEANTFTGQPFSKSEQEYYDAYLEWSEAHEGWTHEAYELGKQHDNFSESKMSFETAMHDIVCAITHVFYFHVDRLGWQEFEDSADQIRKLTKIVGDDLIERIKFDLEEREADHLFALEQRQQRRAERVAKGLPPDYTDEELAEMRKESQAAFKKWETERKEAERQELGRRKALQAHFPTPGCNCPACQAKREALGGDNIAH